MSEIESIKKRLVDLEKKVSDLESLPKQEKIVKKTNIDDSIKIFSEKIKVSESDIKSVFDLEENNKLLIIKIPGGGIKEIIQKISLAVLAGYKGCYNIEDVSAIELRRNLSENEIPIQNFATYLNKLKPSFIRRKGKTKSAKTTYRLTNPGYVKGRKIIKEILKQKK